MTSTARKETSEDRESSFVGSFSQADMRLFVVTFTGTVAANVVTVLVVAVAILLARSGSSSRPSVGSVLIFLLTIVLAVMAFSSIAIRHRRRPDDRTGQVIRAIMIT